MPCGAASGAARRCLDDVCRWQRRLQGVSLYMIHTLYVTQAALLTALGRRVLQLRVQAAEAVPAEADCATIAMLA